MYKFILFALVSYLLSSTFTAADMLQDFCVADLTSSIKLNGYTCKAGEASPEDFSSTAISKPGPTNNAMRYSATPAIVLDVPGLNTLGISMARYDFAPHGTTTVHFHPRAAKMIFILQGELDVGFITTANKHITKTVTEGEVFAFPSDLMHYMYNKGDAPAACLAAFTSQSPIPTSVAPALFAADPPVPDDILSTLFNVGTDVVSKIKETFAPNH